MNSGRKPSTSCKSVHLPLSFLHCKTLPYQLKRLKNVYFSAHHSTQSNHFIHNILTITSVLFSIMALLLLYSGVTGCYGYSMLTTRISWSSVQLTQLNSTQFYYPTLFPHQLPAVQNRYDITTALFCHLYFCLLRLFITILRLHTCVRCSSNLLAY